MDGTIKLEEEVFTSDVERILSLLENTLAVHTIDYMLPVLPEFELDFALIFRKSKIATLLLQANWQKA